MNIIKRININFRYKKQMALANGANKYKCVKLLKKLTL
jgi:hypothetical protein